VEGKNNFMASKINLDAMAFKWKLKYYNLQMKIQIQMIKINLYEG